MQKPITIAFAGDLCLEDLDSATYQIDSAVAAIFKQSDVAVVNLECPLTRSQVRMPGRTWNFKGLPQSGKVFNLFDVFSLANNHILDYGATGLRDTMVWITSQSRFWFGAGTNLAQAARPRILRFANQPALAFLGCTRDYNAAKRTPGTMPMDLKKLTAIIRNLKQTGHFVIVFPHWNYEYVDYPAPADRRFGQKLITAGADLVVGSHPHQIQGYEPYCGKYMFHSLGNFIFNQFDLSKPEFAQTFILTLTIAPSHQYTFTIHPVYTTQQGIYPLRGDDRKAFFEKLKRLSLDLTDPARYPRCFYQNSQDIVASVMAGMQTVSNTGNPLRSIVQRLHRIRLQDVWIKLHSLAGEN